MNPDLRVLVVGGGRRGWMTAAYLNASLRHQSQRSIEFCVLESPKDSIPPAAEPSVPEIRQMLAVIGIDELEFFRRVKATFRLATRNADWLRGTGDFFYVPFDDARAQPIDHAGPDWLRSDRSIAFAETVSPQPIICDLALAARPVHSGPENVRFKYAYHVDEQDFADLLRDIALSRGVLQHVDELANVEMHADGNVAAITTVGGVRLEADLFIDCSGPQGSIIGDALDVGLVDCSQWLQCDRGLSLNVRYEQHYPGRVSPYTNAKALSSGWLREIPLQDRRSLDYIYSSRYADEASAIGELRNFEGPHARELEITGTDIPCHHRTNAWTANCVSLGPTYASMDPLESSGQYLGDLGTIALAECFPIDSNLAPYAFRFNGIMNNRFYELLDFVNTQYSLTQRTDSEFWQDVSKPGHITDRVAARIDFWRAKPPSKSDFVDPHFPGQLKLPHASDKRYGQDSCPTDSATIFGLERYETLLYGMQFLEQECDIWFGRTRPPTKVPAYILADLQQARATCPPHDVFLQQFAGMPQYQPSQGTPR